MTESNLIVLDDGTLSAQVLQKEFPDLKVIKVSGTVEQWFTNLDKEDKIFLPLCYEELGDKVRDILKALNTKGFKNIVLPYEGLDKKGLENKCKEYGVKTDDEILQKAFDEGTQDQLEKRTYFITKPIQIKDEVKDNEETNKRSKRKKKSLFNL